MNILDRSPSRRLVPIAVAVLLLTAGVADTHAQALGSEPAPLDPAKVVAAMKKATKQYELLISEVPHESRQHGEQLIELLENAVHMAPDDAWVIGHLVGMKIKYGHLNEALEDARACRAYASWCFELEGFALHELGLIPEAEAAFMTSLTTMPVGLRCRRSNLSRVLTTDAARWYSALPCGARDVLTARIWWLADPLYMQPGNDRYTEHRVRLIAQELHDQTVALFEAMHGCKPSHRLALERLGWPETWWTYEVVFEAMPVRPFGYGFMPLLVDTSAGFGTTWDLQGTHETYDPLYGPVVRLAHQIAVLERNGEALIVAATDLRETPFRGFGAVRTGLVLMRDENDVPVIHADSGANGVFRFRAAGVADTVLASVEASQAGGGAGRARQFVARSAPTIDGFGVSDPLLFAWQDELPEQLDSIFPRMLGTTRIRADTPVGLFWEVYGAGHGDDLAVSISAVAEEQGLLRRLGAALGLVGPKTAMELTWQDAAGDYGITGRSLRLDLSHLSAGRYTLRVTITAPGRAPVTATRAVELIA